MNALRFSYKNSAKMATQKNKKNWFETFASKATKATGSNYDFVIACEVIIAWMVTG